VFNEDMVSIHTSSVLCRWPWLAIVHKYGCVRNHMSLGN